MEEIKTEVQVTEVAETQAKGSGVWKKVLGGVAGLAALVAGGIAIYKGVKSKKEPEVYVDERVDTVDVDYEEVDRTEI